jgi:hypothetical protein
VLDVGLCQLFDEKLGIIAAFCGSDFDDSFHGRIYTTTVNVCSSSKTSFCMSHA